MTEDTYTEATNNQFSGGMQSGESEDINLGPFNRLLDIEGVDGVEDIFGNVGIPGENPFGSEEGGAPSDMGDLAYGGNPFAGDNFWTIFNGGVNPAEAGGDFGSGSNPFSGGGSGEGGFGSGSNPFSGGGSSEGGFGSGSNPFSGSGSGEGGFGGFGGDNMGDGSDSVDFDFGNVFGISSESGVPMDFLGGINEVVSSGELPFDTSSDLLAFLGLDASDLGNEMIATENSSFGS
ncbi:MAG: hypothetical protein AAF349_14815 [Cyanobacteria bacterium P01_A01_bin.68]